MVGFARAMFEEGLQESLLSAARENSVQTWRASHARRGGRRLSPIQVGGTAQDGKCSLTRSGEREKRSASEEKRNRHPPAVHGALRAFPASQPGKAEADKPGHGKRD